MKNTTRATQTREKRANSIPSHKRIDRLKAREIVESLRLGIVPHGYIDEFTFGRDKETERVKKWLGKAEESSLVLIGEYGSGKTHFLDYIYSILLKEGWAISYVSLDPSELPLHRPKRIYEAILRTFRFKTRDRGFRDFLREVAARDKGHELDGHPYLGTVIRRIRSGTEDEYIWQWIEGKPILVGTPPMYDYSTCANIYCNILSGIGWAVKNVLELKGLVILFDEAEVIDSYWYTSYQSDKSWNFLKGLVLMANNSPHLKEERIAPFHLFPHPGRVFLGEKTGLRYPGMMRYLRYIWRAPCDIKLVLAFAPAYGVLEKAPINKMEWLGLSHLRKNYLKEIFARIVSIYEAAYRSRVEKKDILAMIPATNTRLFIKAAVEALDLVRFYPHDTLRNLLK